MSSIVTPDDLTARARIRGAAFALIAEQGVQGATLRGIARRAGVSAALVNHHYRSKQGVVEAVAEWVLELLRSVTGDEDGPNNPAEASARRAANFENLLNSVPLIRPYIRRMLLDDTPEGMEWFTSMVNHTAGELRDREKAGMARPSKDVQAEAAILNVMSLVPILLPCQLDHVLGGDPDGDRARKRWREATNEMLRSALYPPGRR
jgi:AcrR family transcriptional regulator